MEIIVLKIVACICVTIVAGIMAWRDEPGTAYGLLVLGLVVIFVPQDKVIELFIVYKKIKEKILLLEESSKRIGERQKELNRKLTEEEKDKILDDCYNEYEYRV